LHRTCGEREEGLCVSADDVWDTSGDLCETAAVLCGPAERVRDTPEGVFRLFGDTRFNAAVIREPFDDIFGSADAMRAKEDALCGSADVLKDEADVLCGVAQDRLCVADIVCEQEEVV
jgi:hypothetical protein